MTVTVTTETPGSVASPLPVMLGVDNGEPGEESALVGNDTVWSVLLANSPPETPAACIRDNA